MALSVSPSLYDQTSSTFYLRSTDGQLDPVPFGSTSLNYDALAGDWDGDGNLGTGLFQTNNATFYLRDDSGSVTSFRFGSVATADAGKYQALAGDWDGDDSVGVGLFDETSSTFYTRTDDGVVSGPIKFGATSKADAGDYQAIAGDWDGDGDSEFGLFDETNSTFYLRADDGTVTTTKFGSAAKAAAGDYQVVTGDWDGDGDSDVGIYDNTVGKYFLRNGDGTVEELRFGSLATAQAGEYQALGVPTPVGQTPGDTFTLTEALALFEDNELPETYDIVPDDVLDAGTVTGAAAAATLTDVETIIAGAENTDELVLADIFVWAVEDTAEDLFDGDEVDPTLDAALSGASSVTVTTEVTTAQQTSLDAINDNVTYDGGVVGDTFTLTTGTDAIVGTDDNDTINGAAGTVQDADVIIDPSTTDNDTANLVLTAAYTPSNITNIENIILDWDAFGTATLDAAAISGAHGITFTSSKLGYLGNVKVDNAGDNTIIAGTGASNALDINDGKTVVVDAGQAKTVTVDAAASDAVSATVTAGDATTTIDVGSATAFATTTVTGGAATTGIEINGTGGSSDVATVTTTKDATLSFLTAAVETVDITAADGNELTVGDGSLLDEVTVTSDGAVTLVAGSDELTTHTLTNSTTGLTIDLTSDGAADLSNVQSDLLNLKNALGGDLTVASGANLKAGVDLTANAILASTGTSDVVNLSLTVDQTLIDVTDATNAVETLNVYVEAADSEADGEIDIDRLDGKDIVLTGASKVAIGDGTASAADDASVESIDASAVTGEVNITEGTSKKGDDITIVGSATAKNTVIFATDAGDTSYTGGEANDTVTMAQTTGDSTVVLGNGVNTYTNNTLTDGTAAVLGGAGVDTITVVATDSGADTASVVIQSGAGDDVVSLDLASANDETATVELGAGDDKITLQTATNAGDTLVIDGGADTDTLDLNDLDLTDGAITLSAMEILDDSGGAAKVDGALLDDKTYTIKGDGNLSTLLDVDLDVAGEFDFSGLVLDQTIQAGIGGLKVATAGANTVIGTTGNDTFDVADVAAAVTLTGGKGVDTYTLDDSTAGNAGTATVVINEGDSGLTSTTADTITNFETGVDKFDFNLAAGSATNYAEASADLGATDAAGVAAGKTAADALMDGTVIYVLQDNTNAGADNGYLYVDTDADGTADMAMILTGLAALTEFAETDIIA